MFRHKYLYSVIYTRIFTIGGGSAGCNALYQLGKRGINAVLLEKSKLTSGTTWHTAGLVWSLRGVNDIETEMLKASRLLYASLQEETDINPGWINNGGLYIAQSPVSLNILVFSLIQLMLVFIFSLKSKYYIAFHRHEWPNMKD